MACCKAENINWLFTEKKLANPWIIHALSFRSSGFESQFVNGHCSSLEQRNTGNKMSTVRHRTGVIMVNPYYVILCTSSEGTGKCIHADRERSISLIITGN